MSTATNSVTRPTNSVYALGYANAEHDRLIRQGALVAPITERFFREVGLGPEQRVLDLGSGLGDVSMVAAELVGPSGQVVGIERDASSIARANRRIAEAGFRNITFLQTDVNEISDAEPFDAVVGRFILMFLPDPLAVLKSVARLVRPGGALAFQEPTWVPMLAMAERMPLWSRVLGAIHKTFLRSGVNPEMGIDLHCRFQEIELPAPTMHLDIILGNDGRLISVFSDLLSSVRPLTEQHKIALDELGD